MTFSLSVILYIIEFLIAMNCLGDILAEKLKKRYTCLIGISLYAVALVAFVLIENVYINAFVFFVINFLFAYLCFECTVKNGILCSLFLSVMMVVTEFLFILGSSITENGNIITYSTSLASYTIGAVLSKLMYFVLTKLIIYFGFNFRKVIVPPPPEHTFIKNSCISFFVSAVLDHYSYRFLDYFVRIRIDTRHSDHHFCRRHCNCCFDNSDLCLLRQNHKRA